MIRPITTQRPTTHYSRYDCYDCVAYDKGGVKWTLNPAQN